MTYRLTNCVAIGVENREEAAKFYQEKLGFEVANRGTDWIEVKSGVLRFFLCADDGTTPTFDLAVSDPDEALADVLKNGFTHLSSGNGEHYVRDPFGVCYALSKVAE